MFYEFSIGNVTLYLDSARSLTAWPQMCKGFASFAEVQEIPADGRRCQITVTDAGRTDASEYEPITLHGSRPGERRKLASGVHFTDPERRIDYVVPDGGPVALTLAYPADFETWELDAFQVIRGLLQAAVEHAGRRKFHGSSIAMADGRAIVFVGDSGAGKTSFMLSALRQTPASFVANDKLHMSADGRVHGLPMALSIGMNSLESIPEISVTSTSRIIGGELYLWPEALAAALGRQLASGLPVGLVVAPELDLSAAELTTRPLGRAERQELIDGPVSEFTDRIQPWWLIDELGLRGELGPFPALLDCDWIMVRGNPWRSGYGALLEKLVARA